MKRKLPFITIIVSAILLSPLAHASSIWQEDFNYSDGSLTTVSGGNWAAFSGAGTFAVQNVSGVITLTNVPSGGSGEDLRRALDQTYTSGALYAAIGVSLSVAPNTANGDYFASFYSSAASGGGFETRIFSSATATGWSFGLSPSTSTPVDWGTDLSLNTQYNIVLKFDVDTKAVSMGVFSSGSMPTSDSELTLTGTSTQTAGPDYFTLRQGSGVSMSEQISYIYTGTSLADLNPVPEPSTFALSLCGGFAALMALRRKS